MTSSGRLRAARPATAASTRTRSTRTCWPACASSRSPAPRASRAPSPCRWRPASRSTATAAVMFAGGPGDVGGPSSASAITQALRWLNPPEGTILHARSVETQGGRTTTREFWQSADDPAAAREVLDGAQSSETSGDALYDPATHTIYDGRPPGSRRRKPGGPRLPAGDPVVAQGPDPAAGGPDGGPRARATTAPTPGRSR